MKDRIQIKQTMIVIMFICFIGLLGIHIGHLPYETKEVEVGTFFEKLQHLKPSEIGDTLAGIFGSLAFVAAAIAVVMQSFELRAQREELIATRDELTLSRKAYQVTNINLEQQRFESLFFEMLAMHNSIVDSVDLRNTDTGNVISSGRDCFKSFAKELELEYAERMYPDMTTDKTDEKYLKLYRKHHSDLGHYFRFIYNTMRIIIENKHSNRSHRRLFRALFSDDELLLVFYNARSKHGMKMVRYIEEFELFNNLPSDRFIFPSHRDHFDEKCYGGPQ